MIVTPLSVRSESAGRDALLSHGWEGDVASLTLNGLGQVGFHVGAVAAPAIEAMVPLSARLGLTLISGDDWLVLIGPRAQLGAFARPWLQPEAVQALSHAIGMALPADAVTQWPVADQVIDLAGPVIIGVINASPDSFSSSSRVGDVATALDRAEQMAAAGARIIDIGAESTRPGAEPLDPEVEWQRLEPILTALVAQATGLAISVDTVHAVTGRRAVAAGAHILNDVTAGRHDPALAEVAAAGGAGLILSHSRGALAQIASYDAADYGGDVVGGVTRELLDALEQATRRGVSRERIVLDPGFGFSKTPEQNWRLLDGLDAVVALGRPVAVGVSRKRFLGEATGRPVEERDAATAAACVLAADRGAHLFRVHAPEAVADALAVAAACRQ